MLTTDQFMHAGPTAIGASFSSCGIQGTYRMALVLHQSPFYLISWGVFQRYVFEEPRVQWSFTSTSRICADATISWQQAWGWAQQGLIGTSSTA